MTAARALAAASVVLFAAAARAEDLAPEQRVVVDLSFAKPEVFVHESVTLQLRVEYDWKWFDGHAVQTAARRVDVPVHVAAPLVLRDSFRDKRELGGLPSATIAIGDDVILAFLLPATVREERHFKVLSVREERIFGRPGETALAAPTVRFTYAERFDEDLVRGRVPVDPRTVTVNSKPAVLRVLPLPEEGRPARFGNAVGRFNVSTETTAREVGVGESFRVTLIVRSLTSTAMFDTPDLGKLEGFHVLGALDDRASQWRRITYDLAATRDDVRSIPAIEFPYFDPDAKEYRVARTEPIPLTVRPAAAAPAAAPATAAPAKSPPAGESGIWLVLPTVGAALAVWVVLRRARRQRDAAKAPDPLRTAADLVRAEAAARDTDLAAPLTAYLALRLRCAPAAVVGPDLAARLEAAGVPFELAGRAARLVERLVAARYGGTPAGATERRETEHVLDALESAVRPLV